LPTVFGIQNEEYLHSMLASGNTPEERIRDCMELYRKQLEQEFNKAKGSGYADAYTIKSLTGLDKYFLMFATSHEKGIVLASNVVYGVEQDYRMELQEYRELQEHEGVQAEQLFLIPPIEPTAEEIFQDKVTHLKGDIWRKCKGQNLSRINIHTSILKQWFGRIKTSHMTAALKALQDEGYILEMSGNISSDQTLFKFKASD
jgi:hypothetical protein